MGFVSVDAVSRFNIYDNINNRTFRFYLNLKFFLKLRRRMIIARIIRSDCNLIKLGKDWLPLKTPQTTLITE